MRRRLPLVASATVVTALALGFVASDAVPVGASDHADPIFLRRPESGIADLFAFPVDDQESLAVILTVRPGLEKDQQLPLRPLSFQIHIDTDSRIAFSDRETVARYGGEVVRPEKISAEVQLTYRLSDEVELRSHDCQGIDKQRLGRTYVGVRDDPFIFHRFQSTNVVAIVQLIPWAAFPAGARDLLIWATTERTGKQVDHVGRSLRTMQPRFDFLNTIHPSGHVAALRQRHRSPDVITDVTRTFIPPLFGLRHFDFAPDVMVYSRDRPAGYPNGRLLTDDVAELCCRQGDCLLYEVSLAEAAADHLPRPVKNNVPFEVRFPFLAAPNLSPVAPPSPKLTNRTLWILAIAIGALLLVLLFPWLLVL